MRMLMSALQYGLIPVNAVDIAYVIPILTLGAAMSRLAKKKENGYTFVATLSSLRERPPYIVKNEP